LTFRKEKEKPPFMTRAEIGRKISGLNDAEIAELYEALYLTNDEIPNFLNYIKEHASQPFLFPMATTAAHTGARRSELCRALLSDVDFEVGTITFREKKRVKGMLTTRRIPLSKFLTLVLQTWVANHPGGKYLFCQKEVARSKKRSPTTGHRGRGRASTIAGRLANVSLRKIDVLPVTVDEASDHLARVVLESEWEHAGRWHMFRHSFVSACASNGTDQRFIDEWVGHQTDEQRRRYRHLTPTSQKKAIAKLFG
jgi:Site-specific recombinase XerD